MQIVYCETCGHRIPQEDLDAGRVVSDDFKYYCQNCIPRAEPKGPAGRSSRRIVLITPAPGPVTPAERKPSSSNLTPAPRQPSHPSHPSHATATPRQTPVLPVAIGIGLFVVGAIAVFSMGGTPSPQKKNEPVAPTAPVAITTPAREPARSTEIKVSSAPAQPDPQKAVEGISKAPASGTKEGASTTVASAEHASSDPDAAPAAPPTPATPAIPVVDKAAATPPSATVDDTPAEKKPVDIKSATTDSVLTPTAPESTPEREAAAARDWLPVLRLADARNFKALDDAVSAFAKTYAGTHFADEHRVDIRAAADFAKAPATVDTGMAGWWKFDEGSGTKAMDSSGNNNTGTFGGKPVWGGGKFGKALGFGGKDDYVVIPNSPTLERIQEGEYTLCAWVRPEDLTGSKDPNFQTGALVVKTGFHEGLHYTRSGSFYATHFIGGSQMLSWSFHAYAPNIMHHVAMTVSRSGGVEKLYVDGVQDAMTTWNPADAPRDYGQETWKIGQAQPGNKQVGFPFKGVIDDVRLYNRVLTPAEIAVLGEAPFRKFNPPEFAPAAKFVGIDENTHGNWKGAYGGSGYLIPFDGENAPAYAILNVVGASAHIWGATKDPRGVLRTMDPDRIAACWFSDSSLTLDINLTDGHSHRVSLYCLDWDSLVRAGKVDVMDTAGNVLDSRELANYNKGKYMTWDLKGHVKLVCRATSSNFIVSGVFFSQ